MEVKPAAERNPLKAEGQAAQPTATSALWPSRVFVQNALPGCQHLGWPAAFSPYVWELREAFQT